MNEIQKKAARHLIIYGGLTALLFLYLVLCRAGLGIPCFYQTMFHITCPGCGATRALFSLLRLDLSAAAAYHGVFAFGFYPVLALVGLQDLLLSLHSLITGKRHLSFLQYLSGRKAAPSFKEADV